MLNIVLNLQAFDYQVNKSIFLVKPRQDFSLLFDVFIGNHVTLKQVEIQGYQGVTQVSNHEKRTVTDAVFLFCQ